MLTAFTISQAQVTNTNTGMVYASIQAAIDDATTLNGHTITVAAGTYNESAGGGGYALNLSKGVTVQGAGKGTTIVAWDGFLAGGKAKNGVVRLTAAGATLENLTVDGWLGLDYSTGQHVNYAIFVSADNCTLNNVEVRDTQQGIEYNNANNGTITGVNTRLTGNAGYVPPNPNPTYDNINSGLRLVDSEGMFVNDVDLQDVSRGIVVFQGVNSGTIGNVNIGISATTGHDYAILFYTAPTPGWWNPAWGAFEGDIDYFFDGVVTFSNTNAAIDLFDSSPIADIRLVGGPNVAVDFSNASIPVRRLGQGVASTILTFVCEVGAGWQSTTTVPPAEEYYTADQGGSIELCAPQFTYCSDDSSKVLICIMKGAKSPKSSKSSSKSSKKSSSKSSKSSSSKSSKKSSSKSSKSSQYKTKCIKLKDLEKYLARGAEIGPCDNAKELEWEDHTEIMTVEIDPINLYPVPFGNAVNVDIDPSVVDGGVNAELRIYDIVGKEVSRLRISSGGSQQISTSDWTPGMYIYTLTRNGEMLESGKVAKE